MNKFAKFQNQALTKNEAQEINGGKKRNYKCYTESGGSYEVRKGTRGIKKEVEKYTTVMCEETVQ
jgi:hypothetical protein